MFDYEFIWNTFEHMSEPSQQLSVNLKVRVTPRDDAALSYLAGKKRQKKGQLARTAIAEFLDRQELPPAATGEDK